MSSAPSDLSNAALLQTIHRLLGAKIIVTLTDGRIAEGGFICIDRLGNIILKDVVERREIAYIPVKVVQWSERSDHTGLSNGSEKMNKKEIYRWNTERTLSQAVIPGKRLLKVQIAKRVFEERVGGLMG